MIDNGKQNKFKALIILQVQNIPKNIVVKEERTRKKSIEKLMIPGNFQYLHYHLTSLAKIIPNFSFEIRVLNNEVKIRFIVSLSGSEINELMNNLDSIKDVVITVFQTAFPGLKIEILQGNELRNAWGDIFGNWGNYKFKFRNDGKIVIDKIIEKTFLSILRFEDIPIFKVIDKKSQIDSLIRGLIGSHFDLNYVISSKPKELCNFEKQIQILENEAETIKPELRYKKFPDGKVYWINNSLKTKIEEDRIREELMNIRHAEITGMWDVSGYIVIRSADKDKLDHDIQKIRALITTIFGVQIDTLEKSKLVGNFSKLPMRSQLKMPINMTSEQLSILIHLPENPIPSLSRIDIPEFEIPPERRIKDGISLGKVLLYDQEMYPFQLNVEELRLNTFICGLIGMGKTRLAMNILKQITNDYPNIYWMCLDWKGEYCYLINELKSHKIELLEPGSENNSVELNMFDPQKSNAEEHARKLFAIIREVFKSEFTRQNELSAQMESVCKEVLRRVIKNPKMRSLDSFLAELKTYAKENQVNNRTIMMTVTALINRFDKFKHGVLKKIFDVKESNVDFNILMEKKVIFNLNYLLTKGGTKEDVRLVMNLALKYVIDRALERGVTDNLKHIVLIEDSQFLIPSVLREVPETSLVEDIPLLLRGVGESLITVATRPEVSSDIIANSGVKISFKSPYDSQKIAKYQNLTEIQERYLRIMPKREAIVTLPNFQYPFRIFTDYFDYQKAESYEKIMNSVDFDIKSDIIAKNENNIEEEQETLIVKEINKPKLVKNFEGKRFSEDVKEKYIDLNQVFTKIQEILKLEPKNKKALSEELNINKSRLDEVLNPLLDAKLIITRIGPVFNKRIKQKLYLLPENENWIELEIKNKLEVDFVKNGKIGRLAEEDTFNYIWYGNNSVIKILPNTGDNLNLDLINEMIFAWFEEAIERESFELIIIVPYYDWGNSIRSCLGSYDQNQILIISYYIEDWEKLKDYFNKGVYPQWNSNMIDLGIPSLENNINLVEKSSSQKKLDRLITLNPNKKKII